jgi:hypothetical protein
MMGKAFIEPKKQDTKNQKQVKKIRCHPEEINNGYRSKKKSKYEQ